MFPFLIKGIRVLDVTSTNTASPSGPKISSVIAKAISISKPSTFRVSMFVKPNKRVSFLTPQKILGVSSILVKISTFAKLLWPQPNKVIKRIENRNSKDIFLFFLK